MTAETVVLRADFNGLFGDLLCLSHGEPCTRSDGEVVNLSEGLPVVAFEDDSFENQREYLVASGAVEAAPAELACNGSRWVLRIDCQGVRHLPEIPNGGV
jgi:hypothetical protein